MFFLILADVKEVLLKANQHPLCSHVLLWKKWWNKKTIDDLQKLKMSVSKDFEAKAKELMQQEIVKIREIKKRIEPRWFDFVWDFFGCDTSVKRFQLTCKLRNLDVYIEKALERFDELKAKYDTGNISTELELRDMLSTHDVFFYKLILLFQLLAEGKYLPSSKSGSSLVYEFDTLGFNLSGSIFSNGKTFLLPHNGYIFSGSRMTGKYRWGPEDCTSFLMRFYPELPEMGFSTLNVFKWLDNELDKDYKYMKPIFEKIFEKTDQIEVGSFLFIKGHIWIILGQEGDKVYVTNYQRKDVSEGSGNGLVITTVDWPMPKEERYVILKPRF